MWCGSWKQRFLLSSYFTLSALLPTIHGEQVNVTIDDQLGDPTNQRLIQYNPSDGWSTGQNCDACTATPRPIRSAHMGTWMDATYFPAGRSNNLAGQLKTASVPFIGTAVYVQVILTGSTPIPMGRSDLVFKIDDSVAGTFRREPDGNPEYEFNQTVFSTTGLSNNLHTLTIELGGQGRECMILLDSVIYTKETTDDDSTASSDSDDSSSSTNIGVIVGPVVGGVAAAGVLLAVVFYLRRRRRIQQMPDPIDPYPSAPDGHPSRLDPYMLDSAYSPRLVTIGRASTTGAVSDTSSFRQSPPKYEAAHHGFGTHIAAPLPPSYNGAT